MSVGLNWDSESPGADHIAEVLQCIGTTLRLPYVSLPECLCFLGYTMLVVVISVEWYDDGENGSVGDINGVV